MHLGVVFFVLISQNYKNSHRAVRSHTMTFTNFTHTLLPAFISTNHSLTSYQNQTSAVSPVSILLQLLLVWLGTEGQTKTQMQRAMWDYMYVPVPGAPEPQPDATVTEPSLNVTSTNITTEHVAAPPPPPPRELLPIDQDAFKAEFQRLVDAAYSQPHFSMHHALYLHQAHELNPTFLQQLREIFKENRPSVNLVDLETNSDEALEKLAKRMNEDVGKNTNGIITDMVKVSDLKDTVRKNGIIMLNAAYHADAWKVPFNSLLTMKGSPFYLMVEEPEDERRRRTSGPMGRRDNAEETATEPTQPEFVRVDMMTLRGDVARFRYAENVLGMPGTTSVQLQYKHNASLVLLLPATNQRKHIVQVLRRMVYRGPAGDEPFISQLVAAHKLTEMRFVQVPRQLIDFSGAGWIETLRRMNMTYIFDPSNAELNAMVTNAAVSAEGAHTLHVSHLLHKVMVPLVDQRVDEMELDADIAAENEALGGAPFGGSIRITFNRPYFAFLVGKDGDLLGSALVMNPQQE